VAKVQAQAFQNVLLPFQLGVGTSGGAEIIIHQSQLLFDRFTQDTSSLEPKGILTIDFKNAFNCVRRSSIGQAVAQHFPQLHPFFTWSYGQETPLLTPTGALICNSASGVRQGDPLGPALFSLAIQHILVELHHRFPNIQIAGFLDDISLAGSHRDLFDALSVVTEEGAHIGLQVNRQKCNLLSNIEPEEPLNGVQFSSEGIILLGTPIGTTEYVDSSTHTLFEDMLSPVPSIQEFSLDVAFPLLQACVNLRPQYALRTTPPWILENHCRFFDDTMDNALAYLINDNRPFPDDSYARTIRGLPVKLGGLGIRRTSVISYPAWASSWLRSLDFLQRMSLKNNLNRDDSDSMSDFTPSSPTESDIATSDSFASSLHEIDLHWHIQAANRAHGAADPTFPSINSLFLVDRKVRLKSQKLLCEPIFLNLRNSLLENLHNHFPTGAHWLNSNGHPGTNTWIHSTFYRPPNSLTEDEYLSNMRLRLLLFSSDVNRICCACEPNRVQPQQDTFHPLCCHRTHETRKDRHDLIVAELSHFLGKLLHGSQVLLNPVVHTDEETGVRTSADVQLVLTAHTTNIDVTVVCPSAPSYSSPSSDLMIANVERACEMRTAAKLSLYRQKCPASSLDNLSIFAIDSTGRLGAAATAFIEKVTGLARANMNPSVNIQKLRRNFLKRVTTICAKKSAEELRLWRYLPVTTETTLNNGDEDRE
jgi:hypothetical protein